MKALFSVGGAASIVVMGVATAVALQLEEVGVEAPYLIFLPAVLLCFLIGGAGTAVFTSLLGGVMTWFFFIPPVWSFALPNLQSGITLLLFVGATAFVCAVVNNQNRQIDEMTDAYAQMHNKVAKIHKQLLGADAAGPPG